MVKVLGLICLLFFVSTLKAAVWPLSLDQPTKLVSNSEMLEDKAGWLTIKDLLKSPMEFTNDWHPLHKVGYSLSAWWIRFDVLNNNPDHLQWYLQLQDVSKSSVKAYVLPSGSYQIPQAIQAIPELRQVSFRLELEPATKYSIYLRFYNTNRPLLFTMNLLDEQTLVKKTPTDHAFYAFILGGLLIMSVYNLLTFFNLKELSYLSLTIFIFTTFIGLSSESGMLSLLIPNVNISYIHTMFSMLTIASANSFFYHLMSISQRLPFWANLFKIHFWLALLLIPLIYFLPFQLFYPSLFGVLLLAISTPVLWILYKAEVAEARNFVWAFALMLVSSIPILLFGAGFLEEDTTALKILMFGFLFFTMILSLNQSTRTRELREQAQQSEASSKAKDALLMTMSHELRTPMHAVVSSGTLLQQTSLTVQQRDYVAKLQASAQHMLRLINNILDASRMSHVKPEVKIQAFNLQDILDSLEKLLGDQARNKGLVFELASDYPTNIVLMGDSMGLSQVLLNLLDNAVKFTDSGSVSLKIKPIGQWLNKIDLSFTVSDTGLGLSLTEQEHLFEPFFQASSNINRRYKGTGLGLTISYHLVRHLGGELQVNSHAAKGSKFFFKLNFGIAAPQETSQVPQPIELNKPNYQNKSVLLIDDDPLNQFFGQELLTVLGVQVEVAASGESSLTKLKFKKYDLVFMDVSMPGLDGYQTTQLIRTELNLLALPIIGLTAHAIGGERERCLAAGMNDYLAKPFSIQELEAMLKQWLLDRDK